MTAAPRLRAAAASSYPIRPVEWLVTNRTGSIASRVGPGGDEQAHPLQVPLGERRAHRLKEHGGVGQPPAAGVAAGEQAAVRL